MKKSYLAALERREAMLLSLVDRQVDIKQEILAEMRLEVAAARARVLAAHEEGNNYSLWRILLYAETFFYFCSF